MVWPASFMHPPLKVRGARGVMTLMRTVTGAKLTHKYSFLEKLFIIFFQENLDFFSVCALLHATDFHFVQTKSAFAHISARKPASQRTHHHSGSLPVLPIGNGSRRVAIS